MGDTNAVNATARDVQVMRGAYSKLSNMTLSFGIQSYDSSMTDADVEKYMYGDLKDTLRELGLKNCDGVEEMSIDEMHIENRVVYYALRRFRNSASVFFKFSTASDGKSVDKQMIPKMLLEIIKEYDAEWSKWRKTFTQATIWQMQSTVATSGDYDTTSS